MYKHILVATDGSELADKAVEHGIADAVVFQDPHTGLQNRQLGDTAQVDAHAAPTQVCRRFFFIQHQLTVVHQRQFPRDFVSRRNHARALAEIPARECAQTS